MHEDAALAQARAGSAAPVMPRADVAPNQGGKVVTFEADERTAAIARRNFEHAGAAGTVQLIVGPAAVSVQRLIDEGTQPFDLVFIDADKPSNPRVRGVREFTTATGRNPAVVRQRSGLAGHAGLAEEPS